MALPRKQEVEKRLLDLFLAEGFTGFTMNEIAARLSCSKATLYSIAPNRPALIRHEIGIFFRDAAERANAASAAAIGPETAIRAYLNQIAVDLRPAGPEFLRDIRSYEPARAIYELNTSIAADRTRALVETGQASGDFRAVNPVFVGEVVASVIEKIHRGQLAQSAKMNDAEAFEELAGLILVGVSRENDR